MPSKSPILSSLSAGQLAAIGAQIRKRRKGLGLSALVTAEASGMSRVTLHRIERGEPSVTVGAYFSALVALGLELSVTARDQDGYPEGQDTTIQLEKFPELRQLAWHLPGASELSPRQAFELYERNWRHLDQEAMSEGEWALLAKLTRRYGGGRLLV